MSSKCPITGKRFVTPKNIVKLDKPFSSLPQSLRQLGKELTENGWRIYVVDQSRGYCMESQKLITIPLWVYNKRNQDHTEFVWYVAHEFAHALAGHKAAHGPAFMETLKRICPANAIHHELAYKPANAKAAGIQAQDYNDQLGF